MSTCEVHTRHSPRSLRIEVHHIQPRGMGGPDIASNRVSVCPTGHFNIHHVLDLLLAGKPVNVGTPKERALAKQGYDAWVAAGQPGQPVYQLPEPT